jgi:N-acetylmuramoyl-L-alanine amidase
MGTSRKPLLRRSFNPHDFGHRAHPFRRFDSVRPRKPRGKGQEWSRSTALPLPWGKLRLPRSDSARQSTQHLGGVNLDEPRTFGRKKIPNAESAQVVRTPFQRTGEGERRLRDAAQEPISGFDSRLRGAVAASVCLTALLAAPPATALRPTDLGRAVSPLAFLVDLGYGARGRAGASLQRRLVDLGYRRRGAVDGVLGDETRNAVVAFHGWERIGRDGVVGPRTRGALRRAWAPQPWLPRRRALEFDLRRQVLLVVERGVVRRAIHVSSGAFSPTPEGRFTIVRRMRESWSRPFHVRLPYALYFHRGLAIHGFPIVPDRPASHGCVRVPVEDAPFVFRATPLGTPVLIRARVAPLETRSAVVMPDQQCEPQKTRRPSASPTKSLHRGPPSSARRGTTPYLCECEESAARRFSNSRARSTKLSEHTRSGSC